MIICHWIPTAGTPVSGACKFCGHITTMHSVLDTVPCAVCALLAAAERMSDAVLPVLQAGVAQATQRLLTGTSEPTPRRAEYATPDLPPPEHLTRFFLGEGDDRREVSREEWDAIMTGPITKTMEPG